MLRPNSDAIARRMWLRCALLAAFCALNANAVAQQPTDSADGIVVSAAGVSGSRGTESERIGPAQQPEWTTRRAFAETDVYVIPPGDLEWNQYYVASRSRDGESAHTFRSEFEIGLPFRTQFDIELEQHIDHRSVRYDSTLFELPHALANWGKIPLNPTIDIGGRLIRGEVGSLFTRLLLAEEFSARWHLGADFSFERQLGSGRATSFEINGAVSCVIVENRLSVGAELRAEFERENDDDEGVERTTTLTVGPSVLFKPTSKTHLDFVPTFGVTHDSPRVEAFLIFGVDFGSRGEREKDEGEAEAEHFRAPRLHSR